MDNKKPSDIVSGLKKFEVVGKSRVKLVYLYLGLFLLLGIGLGVGYVIGQNNFQSSEAATWSVQNGRWVITACTKAEKLNPIYKRRCPTETQSTAALGTPHFELIKPTIMKTVAVAGVSEETLSGTFVFTIKALGGDLKIAAQNAVAVGLDSGGRQASTVSLVNYSVSGASLSNGVYTIAKDSAATIEVSAIAKTAGLPTGFYSFHMLSVALNDKMGLTNWAPNFTTGNVYAGTASAVNPILKLLSSTMSKSAAIAGLSASSGTGTIKFTVTAQGGDIYVRKFCDDMHLTLFKDGLINGPGPRESCTASGALLLNGVYTIANGTTATFEITSTVVTTGWTAAQAGHYSFRLLDFRYSDSAGSTHTINPSELFDVPGTNSVSLP